MSQIPKLNWVVFKPRILSHSEHMKSNFVILGVFKDLIDLFFKILTLCFGTM